MHCKGPKVFGSRTCVCRACARAKCPGLNGRHCTTKVFSMGTPLSARGARTSISTCPLDALELLLVQYDLAPLVQYDLAPVYAALRAATFVKD